MMSLTKDLLREHYYEMAQMLIIAGANLDIKDKEGRTAFDRLRRPKRESCLRTL